MFELEDHYLLHGQISIVGLENLAYTKRFESLFKCNLDRVDCAMMATGDYGQIERNKWRYKYGSIYQVAWDGLFHRSANSGFENTKSILIKLLATNASFTNEILKKIADGFLQECENASLYPFRYYYIKYREYRPGAYGKMHNNSAAENPYLFLVMQGYDEFKKHCNFELCTKRYPDWIGSEKYIVITDDAEKDLLEAFPEIMKELSPYVIVGRYFAKMNDDMRYNDSKSAASSFSLDQIDDYENLSEGFVAPDFSEDLCNKDAISRALACEGGNQ